MPEGLMARFGKCAVGINTSPTHTDVVLFGGGAVSDTKFLANTTVLHFRELRSSYIASYNTN